MVKEARRLMADNDEDEAQNTNEDTGPKIKMGRIGKKGKKKPAVGGAYKKEISAAAADLPKPSVSGGFNENDIEFMKKAI